MSLKYYSPTKIRGDTILIPVSWVDSESTPIPFIQRKVRLSVRQYEDDDTTLFNKNSDDHPNAIKIKEVLDPQAVGLLEILITSEESSAFPIGDLPYNLEVTDLDGFVRTILRGRLNMIYDVTR